jgi:hypothetical protein
MASSGKKKSILLSGILSLFFGPLGWLYAAPWAVAIPGSAAYLLVCAILPKFLLVYLLGLLAPLSALGGVVYAMGFNMAGKRTPIFGKDEEPKKLLGK